MRHLVNNILQGISYFICNYIVAYIPFWIIRKTFYRLLGMKIGKGSRILMRVTVLAPSKIVLGERVYINEYCYLDGRGGIEIGNDTSISIYTLINTGQHLINHKFLYATKNVKIEDHVWICARANILGGAHLLSGCVICAGSTVKSQICEELGIYSGVPAVKCGTRKSCGMNYMLDEWKPFFR